MKLKTYNPFLKWWLFTCLVGIGLIAALFFGVVRVLYEGDMSYMSWAVMSVFLFMTGWCGVKTWSWSHQEALYMEDEVTAKFERLEEIGWFTSAVCRDLGFLGTLIGLCWMATAFGTLDAANPTSVQDTLKNIGLGMSTAFYTTIMGLVCSMLLQIQYLNLKQAIARRKASVI